VGVQEERRSWRYVDSLALMLVVLLIKGALRGEGRQEQVVGVQEERRFRQIICSLSLMLIVLLIKGALRGEGQQEQVVGCRWRGGLGG